MKKKKKKLGIDWPFHHPSLPNNTSLYLMQNRTEKKIFSFFFNNKDNERTDATIITKVKQKSTLSNKTHHVNNKNNGTINTAIRHAEVGVSPATA